MPERLTRSPTRPAIELWLAILLSCTACAQLLAQGGSVVTVNSDNALVLNGRKVFPIGLSPGPPNNSTTPTGKDALQEFRDAGALLFRINQNNNWSSQLIADQQAALDWAAQHDMYCWVNLRELSEFPATDTNTPASLRTIVDTFKNHPALGLWKNYDEAWWSGISVASLSNGYYVIHQEDTNHPVVQTHAPRGTVADLQPYNVAADVLALDIYPVAVPPPSNPPITNTNLSQLGDWANVLSQVANGQKEYWLIEQIAFSGTTPPGKTLIFPTFTQSRYMAYEAIANGARGLMFYGGNIAATLNAQDTPYGWNWTFWSNVLKQVVLEIGDHSLLADALVAPASALPITFSGTTAPDIEFCVREVPPNLYILACKRETTTINVTFSGLPLTAGIGDVLYESSRTVTAQNGQFSDTFAPFDVHVYRFALTNPVATNISITTQPASRTNNAGTAASFSVGVTGASPHYQWLKNAANLTDGGNISGATTATLTVANVLHADAATYSVVVTNQYNSVTSLDATLAVIDPVITAQPQGQGVPPGGTAVFTVGATGTPSLAYRWKKNGLDLSNVGNVSGATSATLTLSNVQSGDVASYSVAVSNGVGFALSAPATLALQSAPVITSQPASCTNNAGTIATFSVGAQGASLDYRWLRAGTALSDGGNIAGSATSMLTVSSVLSGDATSYSVIVSNAAGSVTSAPALLTVVFPMPYYEPFNYPAGSNLGGQTNANLLTWSDVGTGISGPYVTNVAGSLSASGLPAASGNSIEFGGLAKSARFSFGPGTTVTNGTLYYSFILKVLDTTGLSTSGIFFAGFNNTIGTQSATPSVVGTRLYIRSATGGFNLGVAKNSSTTSDWVWDTAHVYTNKQVILVVGSYTFNTNSLSDDVSTLWLNPFSSTFGAGTPPTASATATTGSDITPGGIASFVVFQRDVTEPAAAVVDELRIGPTWASVTALPPPSATTLTSMTRLGNGTFQFAYTDSTGQSGTIYASTNLVNWSAIGAATQVSPGQYQFTDPAATNYPRRFYQLRWP
jgi:hypothetical protein